jgi:hypothetical protein
VEPNKEQYRAHPDYIYYNGTKLTEKENPHFLY